MKTAVRASEGEISMNTTMADQISAPTALQQLGAGRGHSGHGHGHGGLRRLGTTRHELSEVSPGHLPAPGPPGADAPD